MRDAPDANTTPGLAKELGPAGVLGVLAAVLPLLGSIALFWAMARTSLGAWLREAGYLGLAGYTLGFALLTGLAILPTYATSALGGWAFGVALGVPAALVGFGLGAMVGYELARRTGAERIDELVAKRPAWRAVRDGLLSSSREGGNGGPAGLMRTTGLIALLRLPPNSPFALTNLLLAGLKVPRVPFVLGTMAGMAPRTTLAVMLGAGLKEMTKESVTGAVPLWVKIAGVVLMLVVVMVFGTLANRALARMAKATQPGAGPAGASGQSEETTRDTSAS